MEREWQGEKRVVGRKEEKWHGWDYYHWKAGLEVIGLYNYKHGVKKD